MPYNRYATVIARGLGDMDIISKLLDESSLIEL